MSARALVTGIAGQDGSYLAELLLADGVEVHGIVRSPSERSLPNIEHVRSRLTLHAGDVREPGFVAATLARVEPDECYHLAAPSFVPDSWRDPAATFAAIAGVTADLLEAAGRLAGGPRVVIANSRGIFGRVDVSPQNERTPCHPVTPYGIAKLAAHQLVGAARERHGIHASSAILYNHESPRRPERFVTRKVTRAAAAISLGLEQELALGDLAAVRDWSAAVDVVHGLRLIALAPEPGDYVLASGEGRSVAELVDAAFAAARVDPDGRVRLDERFVREPEQAPAIGDPTRARELLGWERQVGFEQLIAEMVAADRALLGG